MADELKDSGTVTAIAVVGFVFGLIGMLGSFIPCIGSLSFYIGIPAAIISGIALGVAYSQKAKRTFAIVAVTISVIGVVISGWQYYSIISAGKKAKEALEEMARPAQSARGAPATSPVPLTSPTDYPLSKIGNEPNAELVNYLGLVLLIPNDIARYKCLSHNPHSAFLFATTFNEQKIAALGVKEIMQGRLSHRVFANLLSFEMIEGFADIAKELKTLDEFGVASRRDEIVSKLKECYLNYRREYEQYLGGTNGYYVFKSPRELVRRNQYDFDRQVLDMNTFGTDNRLEWEGNYITFFNEKLVSSAVDKRRFPETMSVPLSIDKAKTLYGDQQQAFCETVFTVKPLWGLNDSGWRIVSNFAIHRITKKYYGPATGTNEPVVTIEIESTAERPFHR